MASRLHEVTGGLDPVTSRVFQTSSRDVFCPEMAWYGVTSDVIRRRCNVWRKNLVLSSRNESAYILSGRFHSCADFLSVCSFCLLLVPASDTRMMELSRLFFDHGVMEGA